MKRSEAVKTIARQFAVPTISSTPSAYWMKYAEIALNTMEQCGMLAPLTYLKEIHPQWNIDGPIGNREEFVSRYEWEPEESDTEIIK
jgi:hypothetical protein